MEEVEARHFCGAFGLVNQAWRIGVVALRAQDEEWQSPAPKQLAVHQTNQPVGETMINPNPSKILFAFLAIFMAGAVSAQSGPPGSPPADWGPVSINLEEFEYPYPVSYMDFRVYNQDVRLAYMDVAPAGPANGRTVIFHHGGLYYGWYWEKQIAALSEAGYRVIAKDRLGWGKSSKPDIPYSISLWASNTARLMDHLGIERRASWAIPSVDKW